MRKFLLCIFLVLESISSIYAQSFMPGGSDTLMIRKNNVYNKTYNTLINSFAFKNDSNKRADKMFGRWENHWSGRLYLGAASEEQMFTTYNDVMADLFIPVNPWDGPVPFDSIQTLYTGPALQKRCLASHPAQWQPLGPMYPNFGSSGKIDKAGHASCVWVDPQDSNYILMGSLASGIWQSFNGGRNWSCATDNSSGYTLGPIGVHKIAVNPNDKHIQYFSTHYRKHMNSWGGFYGFSRGLFFRNSTTGQFLPDVAFMKRIRQDGLTASDRFAIAPKILEFSHTGTLYTCYLHNLYYRTDFTSNNNNPNHWTKINLSSALPANYIIKAMAISKQNPNKIAFMTNTSGNTMYLILFDEASPSTPATVKAITTTLNGSIPVFSNREDNHYGVSSLEFAYNSNTLYFTFEGTDSLDRYFYKIADPFVSSPVITKMNNFIGAKLVFTLHPYNPNLVFFGDVSGYDSPLFLSYDQGVTIQRDNTFINNNAILHADIRHILLYSSDTASDGKGAKIYFAHDGGLSIKEPGQNYIKSLVGDGLNFSLVYHMSQSIRDSRIISAGTQDNGSHLRVIHTTPTLTEWHGIAWGDGTNTAISHNQEKRRVLTSYMSKLGQENRVFPNDSIGSGIVAMRPNQEDLHLGNKWHMPLKFDVANNLLYGVHYVWKMDKAKVADYNQYVMGGNWERLWNREPIDIAGDPQYNAPYDSVGLKSKYKKVQAFYDIPISDTEQVGYIANYGWATEHNKDSLSQGLVFISTNANAPTPIWRNISPDPQHGIMGYYLMHLEVDETNPRRAWIALGFQGDEYMWNLPPEQRVKRVMYCEDTYVDPLTQRVIWHDISKGLPPVPINKLEYVKGSDDVLFAATDIGVYRWNKAAAQWECFMEGMPNAIVTDIEMHYCSGKLRAGTYGRGIWETDIEPNMNSFNKSAPYVDTIHSTTTWSDSKSVDGSIRVSTGSIFTIDAATIYMPRNAKIHLEKGATLQLINGALLTNDCDGATWAGIEMYGNRNASQATSAGQSKVIIRDGSTIRHARIGITDYSAEYWHSGGGIIDIDGGNFENCYRALAFNDYPNFGNSSKVLNTHIWVDSNYKFNHTNSRDFITIFNETGLLIERCTLEDKRNFAANTSYAGELCNGIYMVQAGVNVRRNTFKRLNSGIKNETSVISVNFHTNIDLNVFDNVRESVVQKMNYNKVTNNTIYGMTAGYFGNTIGMQNAGSMTGIYLDDAVISYVHNNGVVFTPSVVKKNGLVSHGNKFQQLVQLTDNKFENAFTGVQVQNKNLFFKAMCNRFNTNGYAFSVNPQSPNGMLMHQGTGFGTNDWRPRNTFYGNISDVYFNLNSSSISVPFKYYVRSTTNPSVKIPATITGPQSGNFDLAIDNTANDVYCYYEDPGMMMGYAPSGILSVGGARAEFSDLSAAGQRFSVRSMELYTFLIDTLYRLDDPLSSSGELINFLEKDKYDMSRMLLIGHYHRLNDSVRVQGLIDSLSADYSNQDKEDYSDYLTLQRHMVSKYGSYGAIPYDSLQASTLFAANYQTRTDFIGDLARSWVLSYGLGIHDSLYIEEPVVGASEYRKDMEVGKAMIVYPNPASNRFTIDVYLPESKDSDNRKIEIFNALGKFVYRQDLKSFAEQVSVNTDVWASGVYSIILHNNGKIIAKEQVSIVK